MKIRIGEIRRIVRQVLLESYGGALGVDPTKLDASSKGFYPYDIERGVDIAGKWYRSPGEKTGDPGRPDDPAKYIGMTSDAEVESSEGTEAPTAAPPEES